MPKPGIETVYPGSDLIAAALEMFRFDDEANGMSGWVRIDEDTVDKHISKTRGIDGYASSLLRTFSVELETIGHPPPYSWRCNSEVRRRASCIKSCSGYSCILGFQPCCSFSSFSSKRVLLGWTSQLRFVHRSSDGRKLVGSAGRSSSNDSFTISGSADNVAVGWAAGLLLEGR